MQLTKHVLLIVLFLCSIIYFSCESNDVATSSTCPQLPVNKKSLVEFFTNAGCIPCIDAHHYFDNVAAATFDTNMILITWHTKYPYIFDSLYRANIPHNQGRSDYYGINSTPKAHLDGISMGQFSTDAWNCQINNELNYTKYLNISLSNNFDPNADSGTVTANITLVTPLPDADNVIHIIITENDIPYITAPNGITLPSNVMRTMVTGTNGEDINIGQSNTVIKDYSIAS